MKRLRNKWLIVLVAVALIAIFAAFTANKKNDVEYFTAKAARGDIRDTVEATGTINAVTTVQVGSQVSGTISQIFVDFNSHVKKGQLIARIEPSLFEAAVLQSTADLESANANLAVARANLEKAQAGAVQTRADYDRVQGLAKEGVMSHQQLDLAKANADAAEAAVSAARAAVLQAEAQVKQRAASVSQAKTNLSHTYLYAPIDGVVVNRAVDVGQTVAASFQVATLFTIAQDLTKMQVYAKTDESDVGMIRTGQKVTFKVDAFPKDTFTGVVGQVRMNPTTVQNVVTYDTVVNFANPELKLFPGMTAYVSIPVAEVRNVLKVPNGALRYSPDLTPDQLKAIYAKYGFSTPTGRGERNGTSRTQAAGPAGSPGAVLAAGLGPDGHGPRPGAESGDGQGSNPQTREDDIGTVWKLLPDKSLEPVRLRIGLTDHTVTEVVQVIQGQLKENDTLVIGSGRVRSGTSAAIGGFGGPGARIRPR